MKTVEAIESEIHNHPFLANASKDFVQTLCRFDDVVAFAPGEVIFKEGGYADAFYLIMEGTVVLEAEGRAANLTVVLQELGRGDVLGWSWLYPPFTWNFTARAKTECKAVCFKAPAVLIHTQEDPAFGYELMKRLSAHVIQRLQRTRQLLIQERLEKEAVAQEFAKSKAALCASAGSVA